MEFNKTRQEARSQRPLPSLCFWRRSEKQDGRPGLWLAETFSTSPLKPLNGIQLNLTGSKISMSSTKFVFLGPIGKTRWPPLPLIGWDIFDFSETAERNSTKLDRKQDLNIFYQVCVFSGRWVNKNFRPGWSVKKVAHCTQVHDMWPFGPLVLYTGHTQGHKNLSGKFEYACQILVCNMSVSISYGSKIIDKVYVFSSDL